MASRGNQRCANCIDTLSFPIAGCLTDRSPRWTKRATLCRLIEAHRSVIPAAGYTAHADYIQYVYISSLVSCDVTRRVGGANDCQSCTERGLTMSPTALSLHPSVCLLVCSRPRVSMSACNLPATVLITVHRAIFRSVGQ